MGFFDSIFGDDYNEEEHMQNAESTPAYRMIKDGCSEKESLALALYEFDIALGNDEDALDVLINWPGGSSASHCLAYQCAALLEEFAVVGNRRQTNELKSLMFTFANMMRRETEDEEIIFENTLTIGAAINMREQRGDAKQIDEFVDFAIARLQYLHKRYCDEVFIKKVQKYDY